MVKHEKWWAIFETTCITKNPEFCSTCVQQATRVERRRHRWCSDFSTVDHSVQRCHKRKRMAQFSLLLSEQPPVALCWFQTKVLPAQKRQEAQLGLWNTIISMNLQSTGNSCELSYRAICEVGCHQHSCKTRSPPIGWARQNASPLKFDPKTICSSCWRHIRCSRRLGRHGCPCKIWCLHVKQWPTY